MSNYRKNVYATGFLLLAAAALVMMVGLVLRANRSEERVAITDQTILQRISDQYFVVTKTAYIDQSAEIVVDKGSRWSNLLWGQTVKAQGIIRVDIGVDLSQLTAADIAIDPAAKTVRVAVPQATVLNASQYGDVEVDTDQGVLKFLLDNNPNEDHNRALAELIAGATKAVKQDQALFSEARLDAGKLLELIIDGTGYKLVVVDPGYAA